MLSINFLNPKLYLKLNFNYILMNWVEKYRPSTLNDITSQNHVIEPLKKALINKNIPHLLLHGPSGCGKTSTIIALAKNLFGDSWKERIHEFNASDERGINVIRDKIKLYAKNYISDSSSNLPNFKIIILDEADTMTSDSQFALRRIIETCSSVTRFCIICNYINKIIEPISSRCAKFRFKALSEDEICNRLVHICENEKINYNEIVINKIQKYSNGDLRQAINFLQKIVQIFGNNLSNDNVDSITNYVPIEKINMLMKNSNKTNYLDIVRQIKLLLGQGYSTQNIVLEFNEIINLNYDLTPEQKSFIYLKIGDVFENLNKGCDEEIQLLKLFFNYTKITSYKE